MRVMGDVVRLNARRYSDKTAIMTEGEQLAYRELNTRCNRIANGLVALGVRQGDRVAVFALNCLDYVAVVYAILKCGAVCVPANFRYKNEELVYVINNSAPRVLFHDRDLASTVSGVRDQFPSKPQIVAISGDAVPGGRTMADLMEGASPDEPPVEVDSASAAFIMYTSGTTGFPKGVLFSHHAYLQVAAGLVYEGDVRHEDVMLCAVPLFHNAGINAMVLPALVVGGASYIHRGSFDPDAILRIVQKYRVTVTMWVPTMLAKLVNDPAVRKYDCSSLKKIWYGSSAVSPTTLDASRKAFKADFYQWYGQTETGMVSVLRPEDHAERSQFTGREYLQRGDTHRRRAHERHACRRSG